MNNVFFTHRAPFSRGETDLTLLVRSTNQTSQFIFLVSGSVRAKAHSVRSNTHFSHDSERYNHVSRAQRKRLGTTIAKLFLSPNYNSQ
jgi:hypothetical protein